MTHPHFAQDLTDPLLTTREAAHHLGVSLRTVQLWVEAEVLPAGRTPGGHRRIRLSAVTELLKRSGIQPAAKAVDAAEVAHAAAMDRIARLTQANKALASAMRRVLVDHDLDTPAATAARQALVQAEALLTTQAGEAA